MLLRGGGLLALANLAAALANYLFQAVIGRLLTIEQYATVNALLSITLLAAAPVSAISWSMTKFVAQLAAQGRLALVASLIGRAALRLLLLFVPAALAWAAAAPLLGRALQIRSRGAVLMTLAVLFWTLLRPLVHGSLRGLERFGVMASSNVLQPALRVAFAGLLAAAGWGPAGVLLGVALSLAAATLFSLAFLPPQAPLARHHGLPRVELYRFFWPTLWSMTAYAILAQADMVAAKAGLAPEQAGYYSAAATFARGTLALIIPLVSVLFPRISLRASGRVRRLELWLVAAVGLFQLLAIIAGKFLAPLLIQLLLGRTPPPAVQLLPLFLAAISPLALASVPIHFRLARGSRWLAAALMTIAGAYIAALGLFHSSPNRILACLATAGLAALVAALSPAAAREAPLAAPVSAPRHSAPAAAP